MWKCTLYGQFGDTSTSVFLIHPIYTKPSIYLHIQCCTFYTPPSYVRGHLTKKQSDGVSDDPGQHNHLTQTQLGTSFETFSGGGVMKVIDRTPKGKAKSNVHICHQTYFIAVRDSLSLRRFFWLKLYFRCSI